MLPVTIVGGYLGVGKTTLVNHLLRHANGLRLAVLVNEFGALPIDEDLIEARDGNVISIAGGCVCCSYGNDLTLALMEMAALDPAPDHVVLEASGVAIPGAIAASLSLLDAYALDGIVVLADAETIREQAGDPYIGDTIGRQLADADLVVLNKADLVPPEALEDLKAWLSTQATGAEVVPAHHGALPVDILLQGAPARERAAAAHPDPFTSRALTIDRPVSAEALARGLADAALGLVRAKGFVMTDGGALRTVQVVGRRWMVTDAPAGARAGLVVIGHQARFDEAALERLVASL